MGVLDSVLQYKARKEAEEAQAAQAIPQAVQAFITGRQQQQDNMLKTLTVQADLASKGYRVENGQLVKDASLASEKDKLQTDLLRGQVNYLNQFNAGNTPVGQDATSDPATGFGAVVSGTSSRGMPVIKNDTPLDQANRATGLRKEFTSNPIVKDFQEITSKVSSLDKILSSYGDDAKSYGTKDQALITTFNKITDPQSVVRESEYARTPEGQSLIDNFTGRVEKLQKGGAGITKEYREQLVADAKKIADGVGNSYNSLVDNYTDLAGQYRVDPKMVLGTYKKHEGFSNQDSGSSGAKQVGKFKIVGVQ